MSGSVAFIAKTEKVRVSFKALNHVEIGTKPLLERRKYLGKKNSFGASEALKDITFDLKKIVLVQS